MLDSTEETAVRAAAEGYCRALHTSDADFLDTLVHENFVMASVQPDGRYWSFDKDGFVGRARERDPFEGEPNYQILTVDMEPEMAHVKLWVDMAPRRYCDYLGFLKIDGEWKLATKLWRTADGPAL